MTGLKIKFNQHFRQHKVQLVGQCMLATLIVLLTLVALNMFSNQIVIASIGSTAFTVFTMPHRRFTRPRFIIGGYVVGILVGLVCFWLMEVLSINDYLRLTTYYDEFFGAVAVGMSIFIMVMFNVEHPPATALALGMIINTWTIYTLVTTVLAVMLILLCQYVLRHYLIDLVKS
jgi:CBS domain-containing membrane protein